MKYKKADIYRLVLYLSFGILCFVFFSYLTFPYGKVANVLISRLEARTPFGAQVEEVGPYLFPGISLHNLKIFIRTEEKSGETGTGVKRLPVLKIDRIRIRLRLLSLLRGRTSVFLESSLASGKIKGLVFRGRDRLALRSKWEGIQMGEIEYLNEHLGLNSVGTFSGQVDLLGDPRDLRKGNGVIQFNLTGGALRNATLMKLVSIPDLAFDRLEGKLVLKEGKFVFDQFKMEGKDLGGEITGTILLRRPLSSSMLSLNLKVKPSPEIDNQIGYLFNTAAMRKDPQGFYTRRISGTLGHPR